MGEMFQGSLPSFGMPMMPDLTDCGSLRFRRFDPEGSSTKPSSDTNIRSKQVGPEYALSTGDNFTGMTMKTT